MSIERANGTNNRIDYTEKKVIELPKKVETNTQNVSVTRADERVFTASLQRFQLDKLLADTTTTADVDANIPATSPEPEINYFDIDGQADELIAKHTDDVIFGIGSDLDPNALGGELADIAKTEPERAAALTDNILDKIGGSDKDEIAQSFVESLTPGELREFAGTERGAALLGELKDHLLTGAVWGDERDTAARIDSAIQTAEFVQSNEFTRLSPEVQTAVLQRLDANEGNTAANENLMRLAGNVDFATLSDATQNRILDAFDKNKEDTVFTDGLTSIAGNQDFYGLTETQRAEVLTDMETFATTESYKGEEGGLFGIGGRDVSTENKTYLLGLIAGTSVYSQQNPNLATVSNSLDKILSGEITMVGYYDDGDGKYTNGRASGNTMEMNLYANRNRSIGDQIDTYVHEINHISNGNTDAGTPERFLDEYRARVVGREAGGRQFNADIERDSLTQLSVNGGNAYGHLNDLYANNAQFRQVIDDALTKLNENPPVLTTPEQLRQNLLDAGFNSDYLNTPSNLDNH